MNSTRNSRTRAVVGTIALAGVSVFAACQAPTQIILHIRSNVACERESPTPIVSVGRIDRPDDNAPFASTHVDCRAAGDQGTLVITPTSTEERDATIGIRVALRYAGDRDPGRDTGDCSLASAAYCIVQRRIVAFRPHETLDIPIQLDVSCKGVYCSALETCNRAARCVSAECTGRTCEAVDDSGKNEPLDGSAGDGTSSADTGIPDGATTDGSRSDASGDAGPVSGPSIECDRTTALVCGAQQTCCVDGANNFSCAASCNPPSAGGAFTCDDKSDCSNDLYCVYTHASGAPRKTDCAVNPSPNPYQEVACKTSADCPGNAPCTTSSTGPPWGTCPKIFP